MSLKLTLAALALGLAAATDCCSYELGDPKKGCNCLTEPHEGCFKTGEDPFSFPNPGPEGGFRPKVDKEFCDPPDYLAEFLDAPGGFPKCQKDLTAPTPDGVTTFCCGGKYWDCAVEAPGGTVDDCFATCAFNWCKGEGDASGFDRVDNPDFNIDVPKDDPAFDSDATICVPITEPPTPQKDEFPCDGPGLECPVGDASGCPDDLPACCPTSSGRRRRRLNFYPSTGCCEKSCD